MGKKVYVEVEAGDIVKKCGSNECIEIRIFGKIDDEITEIQRILVSWDEEHLIPCLTTEELVNMEEVGEEQKFKAQAAKEEIENEGVEDTGV